MLNAQVGEEPEYIQDSVIVDADLFGIEEYARISLKFSFKDYTKNKNSDKYIPAELTYMLGDSLADIVKPVRVRARGNNRKSVCSFPPLRLNISKTDIDNETLKNVKNIKIVTHCRNLKSNNRFILKEYLTYKIYQVISPYSFKVRLARVTYIDTSRKNKETFAWAFLIEPEKMVAERLGLSSLKMDNLGFKHTEPEIINTVAMFNYMIGNADYSVAGRHNVKLLKSEDLSTPLAIPVPYDFDYSGLVDTNYAQPGENLGIESVRERYFTGPCRTEVAYNATIEDLVAKKQAIFKQIEDFPYLDSKEKQIMIDYLDSFYKSASHKGFVQRNIISTCTEIN
jgi:hypothetical protein